MEEKQQFEVWRDAVEPAIQSKVDEFHFLGYERATKEEIWDCLMYQLRKSKEYIHMNQFVNHLLLLKPHVYMNWLTIHAYKEPTDWFVEYEKEEI
ncbi:post-transcriptional regulator [Alkalihalobacillus sp. 1P02AB]|uniref:post-transcriptional regulator n=1 Tax=Alkalihalobacillus sp. 1P02AB TaxID=3132260 RepID=UPI0039A541F2